MKFAVMSDHPVIPCCYLSVYVGLAVRYGLPKEAALRAITIDAAEILGMADRVGSLTAGKDADLVVWTDGPLSLTAKPEMVVIDGVIATVGPGSRNWRAGAMKAAAVAAAAPATGMRRV